MTVFTAKVVCMPLYKIQVGKAHKNIYGKQQNYLYFYRVMFFDELHLYYSNYFGVKCFGGKIIEKQVLVPRTKLK
jgi:hypothetical protein